MGAVWEVRSFANFVSVSKHIMRHYVRRILYEILLTFETGNTRVGSYREGEYRGDKDKVKNKTNKQTTRKAHKWKKSVWVRWRVPLKRQNGGLGF